MPETRILFVDDDRDILAMVEQYLTIKGYDVTTVDNGIEAVGIVKEKEAEVEQTARQRLTIHHNVFFHQVPAAGPYNQDGGLVIECIVFAIRIGK